MARIRNKPSAMSIFLSRANEQERRLGYGRIARRLREFQRNRKAYNARALWLLVLAERSARREEAE